jgi:hypothetical protein
VIYEQFRRELFITAWTVLRRADLAEDAMHSAFVKLAQLGSPPVDPKLYVFRSVRNAAIEHLVKKSGSAMNELERLIAALPRPEPGEQLDQRIRTLLARQPVPLQIRRSSATMAWIATAACIGAIGFFLGRQSVVVGPMPTAVAGAAPASDPPAVTPDAANITNIPLNEEQLAGLLARPAPREGMFGRGPMTIEVSKTP